MQCARCGAVNPSQARFCMDCGQSLVSGIVCGHCQTLLPPQAHFCYHCGAYVSQAAVPASYQPGAPAPAAAMPVGYQPGAPAPTPAPFPVEQPAPATAMPVGSQHEAHHLGQLPPARPLEELQPSLKRYLTAELYEPLERRPKDKDFEAVRNHLASLIETVKTYLPRPVIEAPQPPGEPAGNMYRGVFLFGDVSGFTPLSEKLKALGQAGAEKITSIINSLFTELTTVLFDHGGILLKFGGDAMLGLFPADTDDEMAQSARRAAQAALAMQQVLKKEQFAEIEAMGEKRSLKIKCGISAGPYFAAHIGTQPNDFNPNGTMAYVTTGQTVNLAEAAEGHANPTEVAMTRNVAELLGEQAQTEAVNKEPDENFRLLLDTPPLEAGSRIRFEIQEPPPGAVQAQITYLVDRLNRLTPYLSDELIQRIVTNPRDAKIPPEHRPVTVMFANYKGISKLIEKHGDSDPGLITQQLNSYFVHMASIVEKYEGTLARMDQYAVGDRIVIFFGAPRAHEDDPVRAVYTALEMKESARKNFAALRTASGVFRFEQRIGINTGHLFAGNAGAPDLRQEYTLMGDDINMAARLMSNAPWDEIYVSRRVKEAVSAFVDFEDRGEIKVKGKEIRIPTFSVLGRRDEVGRTRGLGVTESPLTGRDALLNTFKERGQIFLNKRGQIVSLIGNSGLGKSRLMREFKTWLQAQPQAENYLWIEARALSFSEQMSYWMAGQMMRGLLKLKDNANEDDVLYTLGSRGEELLGENAMDAVPYLAHMMGLDLGEEWAWVKKEDPKVRQKQTLWAAAEFFTAAAKEYPIVIALDDLHWADEASLVLIEHLLHVTDTSRLMFILIFRAVREKGCWKLRDKAAGNYPHRYTEIELSPLNRELSSELLAKLLPGVEFTGEVHGDILDKATGNPFYLEEVVRSLIDSRAVVQEGDFYRVTDQISKITVPATLHAAIVARIDRLTEDARIALQVASVIGRQFRMELLRNLVQAEAEIDLWVVQLERGGLVRPAESDLAAAVLDSTYAFPDALVQEVAYDTLLVQNRQQLHQRIGEMLEAFYADSIEQNCELLAYHFSRSNEQEKALKYLAMAAQKSADKYANATAIQYYSQILQIRRAQGDKAGQAGALYSMGVKAYEIGDYPNARPWLEESIQLLREIQDAKNECWSVMYLGMVDLKEAHYTQSAERHTYALEQARQRQDRFQEGIHLTNLARVTMRLGQYDLALQQFEQSLEIKKGNNDIMGQGFALFYLGLIHIYKQEFEQAEARLNGSIEMWQQVAKNDRGLAYCRQGLGLLALGRQEFEQAEKELGAAIQICEKLVLKAELIENLSHASQALLGLDNLDGAREASARAIHLLEEQKDVEEVQQIYLNHARVLAASKDPAAKDYLDKAASIMQTQAERIEDPPARQVYLSQVKVNQEIAALAA